ncbi:MAG: FAD:protein FMN transferase [Actinomycetia bacterium]|nr:FAD:protein FMN transferase [Actinomycetes bacterium]
MSSSDQQDSIPRADEYHFIRAGQTPSAEAQAAHFYAFNTVISLQSYDPAELCEPAFAQAFQECRRFEQLFSRTLTHSDISAINRSAAQTVEIDRDTFRLLSAAQYYCRASQNTFDITIGAASALWNFAEKQLPDPRELAAALEHVDWQKLQLAAVEDGTGPATRYQACLTDPQAAVDVGGMAKGYIADRLTELLKSAALTNFYINLGGNTTVQGYKPGGSSWRVGVQDPNNKDQIAAVVETTNCSLVTSGIYERCFSLNGVLYHHILDTKTGYPVHTDVAGVTVVCPDSIDAEGFSTTLLALGQARGAEFVQNHPQILNVIYVDAAGRVTTI